MARITRAYLEEMKKNFKRYDWTAEQKGFTTFKNDICQVRGLYGTEISILNIG